MKSYLSLIPISSVVRKRQNRLTLLCIAISVFLVTSVFGMAEMGVRMETDRLMEKHGNLAFLTGQAAGNIYPVAGVLAVLVVFAGVLMVSGSMNSMVLQRTKFFGMMRCIGMGKDQIIRFVRFEALNWCKTAIPAGLAAGTFFIWILCAVLKFLVGEEWSEIPMFQFSPVGIITGTVMGITTVLLAAQAPAKQASKVSPITALSGNADSTQSVKKRTKISHFKIESVLGIQHAMGAKKNLWMISGSFALSIVLFFSFLVITELAGFLLPQPGNAAEIKIAAPGGTNAIPGDVITEISKMDSVKRVFGRKGCLDLSLSVNGNTGKGDLISYSDFDLDCLLKDRWLQKGRNLKKIYGDSHYVLGINGEGILNPGDVVTICGEELEIAGLLKYNPFTDDGSSDGRVTVIASDETFTRLTGIRDYSLVLIQGKGRIPDSDVEKMQNLSDGRFELHDGRDSQTKGTYTAFILFSYGFLLSIALVAFMNILNSISISVSSRMGQYGIMRSVGMETDQVIKMIVAEAAVYAISGCVIGCTVGLFMSRLLYDILITAHFSYAVWSVPMLPLVVVLLFVSLATFVAVRIPAKRIRSMVITDTMKEL